MANFNKVVLLGNLTADPEVRYTPRGTAVTDIRMAINRVWNDEQNQRREETTYLDVTLWGRQAEVAGQYLNKGRPVLIEGRLQMDTWEDKATGQKRSKLKVVGEGMQLLGGGGPGGGGGNGGGGGGGGNRGGGNSNSGGGGNQGGGNYDDGGGNSGSGGGDFNSGPPPQSGGAPAAGNFDNVEDDDIPF